VAAPTRTRPALERTRRVAEFFDRFADVEPRWRRRNRTYHRLIESIHRFVVPRGASILEVGVGTGDLLAALEPARGVGIDVSERMVEVARERHPELELHAAAGEEFLVDETFDYVVLSDLVPFADDLLAIFKNVRRMSHPHTRIVIHSYSQLWRPVIRLAELLRLKQSKPIENWVTPEDVGHLLALADLEVVTVTSRILLPKKVPLLTTFANGVLANVWGFRWLALTYWVVARPRPDGTTHERTVSVVVPARNEEGTIDEIIERIPEMGAGTEIVFVEGGSRDDTYAEIERQIERHADRDISLYKQTGQGKGDAVRLGFSRARNDILMILDADLSVAPEALPQFYDALAEGRADFVNGSRLVYGMESGAMRFLNVVGNKFFSRVFSGLLDQSVKDTLCGTKVLSRADYEAIAAGREAFGDFDPFGDFDLLLGSARLGHKIVDVPVRYHARTYGTTNISRFTHGWLLLRMAFVAFYKLKVLPVRV
jgi:ubiquinone/menaquinone biosynthesis C-methylase UbiE